MDIFPNSSEKNKIERILKTCDVCAPTKVWNTVMLQTKKHGKSSRPNRWKWPFTSTWPNYWKMMAWEELAKYCTQLAIKKSLLKDFHGLQGDKKSGLRRAKLTALRIVLLDSSAGGTVPARLRRGPESCPLMHCCAPVTHLPFGKGLQVGLCMQSTLDS